MALIRTSTIGRSTIGSHAVNPRSQYGQHGWGIYNVLTLRSAEGQGKYRVILEQRNQSGRGLYGYLQERNAEGRGDYRVQEAALDLYEIFIGADSPPTDFTSPDYTTASLPLVIDVTLHDAHPMDLYFIVRKRNAYNLTSFNVDYFRFQTNAGGDLITRPSDASELVGVAYFHVGDALHYANITAEYFALPDGVNVATGYEIWADVDGADPFAGTKVVDNSISDQDKGDGMVHIDENFSLAGAAPDSTLEIGIKMKKSTEFSDGVQTQVTIVKTGPDRIDPAGIFYDEIAEQDQAD